MSRSWDVSQLRTIRISFSAREGESAMATSLRNMSRISYPNLQKDQHPKALYVKLVMYEAYRSKQRSQNLPIKLFDGIWEDHPLVRVAEEAIFGDVHKRHDALFWDHHVVKAEQTWNGHGSIWKLYFVRRLLRYFLHTPIPPYYLNVNTARPNSSVNVVRKSSPRWNSTKASETSSLVVASRTTTLIETGKTEVLYTDKKGTKLNLESLLDWSYLKNYHRHIRNRIQNHRPHTPREVPLWRSRTSAQKCQWPSRRSRWGIVPAQETRTSPRRRESTRCPRPVSRDSTQSRRLELLWPRWWGHLEEGGAERRRSWWGASWTPPQVLSNPKSNISDVILAYIGVLD